MGKAVRFAGLFLLLGILSVTAGLAATGLRVRNQDGSGLRIAILYDNVPFTTGCRTDWGFAALIQGTGQNILFDTGGDGAVLLANMGGMGIDPDEVDVVFLSHIHGDHTRGLRSFRDSVRRAGARVVPVATATKLFDRVYSSGPIGHAPEEQALIIDTTEGLVVLTGCAHPGVVEIVRAAMNQHRKPVRLLVGGLHLFRQSERRILKTIGELKALGVVHVAPSHCTGERALALFRRAWGGAFIESGCGAVIELAP
jgi:7,8-dihydropterin-6-yl-methyl-4-(beta-D-ribofuranosyl)aminobenzene 5'-phosphate synthase